MENSRTSEIVTAERELKNLKRCAVIFAVLVVINMITIITVLHMRVILVQMGILLSMAGLAWSGWKASSGEKHLKGAISGGKLCVKIFLVVCVLQAVLGVMQMTYVGTAAAFSGFVEILLYTLLVWFYYKNAKYAGKLLEEDRLKKAAAFSNGPLETDGRLEENEKKEYF